MPRHVSLCFSCILFSLLLLAPASAASPDPAASDTTIEGFLSIVWGDHPQGEWIDDAPAPLRVTLTTTAGESLPLAMSDELLGQGVIEWSGRRVKVFPANPASRWTEDGALRVRAMQLADDASIAGGVEGSQPWISVLCRFADITAEPRDLTYFQQMYDNAPGRLDHYWREVSFDSVNVVGSIAIDWVSLPGNQTDYVPTPGSGTSANLSAIFNDCTAAVDDIVDFSGGGLPFAGINLMLNASLDCCAWGGGRFATLDGVSKVWRTTWNPPWAFNSQAVIAHEMGHGFGLPHANNFDADSNPYDSPWDVMSSATGYSVNDATYGALGKHVNAYHKDRLGWFPSARRFEAPTDSRTAIELDHIALADSTNTQIVVIPVDDTRWYTVEARVAGGAYEGAIVDDAVIIHEVLQGRSEPAWAVDADEPPGNYGDNPGTMWLPGETFIDAEHQIEVTIDFATATGFAITVQNGDPDTLFADGFESGDITAWSQPSS